MRNGEILRANNRDRSGINGEFLCVKGRFGFDFVHSDERLQSPLIRKDGELSKPMSWSEALALVAKKFGEVKARGGKFGVIGSTRTTNEENFYLQKFARQGSGTNNIDHHRTGDVVTLLDALNGKTDALATVGDLYTTKAALVIGARPVAAAPAAGVPVAGELPASQVASVTRDARRGARRRIMRHAVAASRPAAQRC